MTLKFDILQFNENIERICCCHILFLHIA
jgi:hypothetical protein